MRAFAATESVARAGGRRRRGRTLRVRVRWAYRQYRWRVLYAYYGGVWAFIALIGLATVINLSRITGLKAGETLAMGSLVAASFVAAVTIAAVGTRALMRPLAELEDVRAPSAVRVAAWRRSARVPILVTGWNCVVITAWASAPLLSLALVHRGYVNATMLALNAMAVGLTAMLVGVAATVGAELLIRPFLREAARALAGTRPAAAGPSVRLKLVVAVPVLALAVAGWAVPFGGSFGAPPGAALRAELLALAAAVVVTLPVTRLLAHSILRPLDDLVAAAERLKAGDFTTPVPESSLDEWGALARSFNEAMEGLAERQRLAAENERLLHDVRASRARIVVASDEERRRVERNIHDGAQQRLVALALDLRMLEDAAQAESNEALARMASAAGARLADALDELRELARGLHPAVLETDGLGPALEQLAARAPLPVDVHCTTARMPAPLEAAAYFVAAEALANVAKHARASRADVSVTGRGERVVLEIADDGVGGARQLPGSGLAGLADRVAALGGTLHVSSPPGAGTLVTATLAPCRRDGGRTP